MGDVIYAHIIKVVSIGRPSQPDVNRTAGQSNMYQSAGQPAWQPQVLSCVSDDPYTSGRTLFLGGSAQAGKTVLLRTMTGTAEATIIRVSNGERVSVTDSIFKIGKEKTYVNYYISGNPTVSRNHAQIEYEDGIYYLIDMGSTNHSYIGESTVPLEPEEKYPLQNGDRFRLSNEEFIFEVQ